MSRIPLPNRFVLTPKPEAQPSTTEVMERRGPRLVYKGGHLIENVKVFTIFLGSAWNEQYYTEMARKLNDFLKYIVTSEFIDRLSEYSITEKSIYIGHGEHTGTMIITMPDTKNTITAITSPNPQITITDLEIQHLLVENAYFNNNFQAPSLDTIYIIYIAPGMTVSAFGERSGEIFCAYHNHIRKQIFYNVIPYPIGSCTQGMDAIDALTTLTSHTLSEQITDPVPGEGWNDDRLNREIGDICVWQTKKIGGYTVQKQWSNKQNACI